MFFIFIACFFVSMISASEENFKKLKAAKYSSLDADLSVIIENDFLHLLLKRKAYNQESTVVDIIERMRNINQGQLPLSHQVKARIAERLCAEFSMRYEAIAYFSRFADDMKIYSLSKTNTLRLLSKEYDKKGDDLFSPLLYLISLFGE